MISRINSRKFYICFFLLIASVLFFITCAKKPNADEEKKPEEQEQAGPERHGPGRRRRGAGGGVISIKAITLTPQSINESITLGARVRSASIARITPKTNGTVTSIRVREGQKVQVGTILLYVDASRAGQSFLPSPVSSPINGVIASLPISVGNSVSTTTEVAIVSDPSKNRIYTNVPETYAGKVKVDQSATLHLLAFENKGIDVKVSEVSAKLDEATLTLPVVLDFIDSDNNTELEKEGFGPDTILSGMYGSLTIVLQEHENVLVVAPSMIVIQKNKDDEYVQGVFVVDNPDRFNSTVSFTPIISGVEDGNKVEIRQGLSEGDVVVQAGQDFLRNKSDVHVLEIDDEKRDFPTEDELANRKLNEEPPGSSAKPQRQNNNNKE